MTEDSNSAPGQKVALFGGPMAAVVDNDPAPGQGEPPNEPPNEPPESYGGGPGGSPNESPIVTSEMAIEECLHAHRVGRRIIAVVGLPTTGKTFFIKRLMNVVDYDVETPWGQANTSQEQIDRTKGVLLHKFTTRRPGLLRRNARRSPRNFDVYDVPGDFFAAMVRSNFALRGDRERARVVYALCAFADAFIFVAPALQVLKPKVFLEEGDGLLLDRSLRDLRLVETREFISSLNPMSRVIVILRDRLRQKVREHGRDPKRLKAASDEAAAWSKQAVLRSLSGMDMIRRDAAIETIDEILQMTTSDHEKCETSISRLPHPAMLLLSRADELRAKMRMSRNTFDADPSLALSALNGELMRAMSGWFSTFAVDYMTAQEGHTPGADFDPGQPGYGVRGLVEKWVLPAVNVARRPAFLRALTDARVAYSVRRLLDPDFGRNRGSAG